MNAGKAFTAGVVGGAVMSLIMALVRVTLVQQGMNLEMLLGTMLGLAPTAATWVVGLVMHLVISGLIALIYAWAFERVTHRAGWMLGAGFGLIHAVIGGLFMGIIPAMHAMVPGELPAPGFFMANQGAMGVFALFVLHVIYGAVVGAIYAPVEHPHREPAAAHR